MNIPEATRAEFRKYPVEKKWQMVLLAQKKSGKTEVRHFGRPAPATPRRWR